LHVLSRDLPGKAGAILAAPGSHASRKTDAALQTLRGLAKNRRHSERTRMPCRVLALNGPDPELLTRREPDVFARTPLIDLEETFRAMGKRHSLEAESTDEGRQVSGSKPWS
jgi:hypothetical protein